DAAEAQTEPDKVAKPDAKKPEGAESKEGEPHAKHKGEGKGGEHKKGKGGEHAEKGETVAKGGAGGAGGVHRNMREPASAPSHATQKRIAGVKAAAGAVVGVQTALPSAPQSVS